MNTLDRVQVFIASPSELAPERQVVRDVCRELNETVGVHRGVCLCPVGWEDCVPGIDSDPQAVINSQVPSADIFVGIIWKRLGTPTPRAASGTVEEFERAVKHWAEKRSSNVLVYFKTVLQPLRSQSQIREMNRVLEFRRHVAECGVYYGVFQKLAEFEKDIRRHIGTIVLRGPVVPFSSMPRSDSVHRIIDNPIDLKKLVREVEEQAASSEPTTLVGSEWHFCLLYLDIDCFNRLNDEFGFAAGDDCIYQLAFALYGLFKDEARILRVLGDQFVTIFRSLSVQEALNKAEEARRRIEEECVPRITVSIGFAYCPPSSLPGAERMLRAARVSSQKSKLLGGNRTTAVLCSTDPHLNEFHEVHRLHDTSDPAIS